MIELKAYGSTAHDQIGKAVARHLNGRRVYSEEAREELFRAFLHSTHGVLHRYGRKPLESAANSVIISNNIIRLDVPNRIEWIDKTTCAIWDATNNKFTVFAIEDHPIFGKFTVTALGLDMCPKGDEQRTFKELLLAMKFKGKYAAKKRQWQQENK